MKSALSAGQVIRKIHKNEIAPVYFLDGDDGYLQQFFIDELSHAFLKENGNKRFISLDDDKEQDLFGELSAFSLFEEKRIIVVRQIRKLTIKGKDEMLSYLASPNVTNCLILIDEENIRKNKFIDSLKQNSVRVDVKSPQGKKFKDWANFIVRKKSIKIKPDALDLLIELQGDSLSKIFNELDKLSLLLGEDVVIDKPFVESTAIHQRQFNIEQLQVSLGDRDLDNSMKILTTLLEVGTSKTLIAMNLAALFQELLWIKMGGRETKFSWLIRGAAKKNLQKFARNYQLEDIKNILLALRKIDVLTKTTSLSADALFEPLIIEMCTEVYA